MDTEHTPLPLLPCPFCGSPGLLTSMDRRHFVQCTNEDCAAEPCGAASIDGVASIWNRRPVHSVNLLPEMVEALELSRTTLREAPFLTDAMLRTIATIDALLAKATS
jgi:hypothetical protein